MSKASRPGPPQAPEFSPFRGRVRVPVSPHLTVLCYAPSLEEGLQAERMIEAGMELREAPDDERAEALNAEMEAQFWRHVVGVELRDEAGAEMPVPATWRADLWSGGSVSDEQCAGAWVFLFRRQYRDATRSRAAGRAGRGPRSGGDRGRRPKERDKVPAARAAVPNPKRAVRPVP